MTSPEKSLVQERTSHRRNHSILENKESAAQRVRCGGWDGGVMVGRKFLLHFVDYGKHLNLYPKSHYLCDLESVLELVSLSLLGRWGGH